MRDAQIKNRVIVYWKVLVDYSIFQVKFHLLKCRHLYASMPTQPPQIILVLTVKEHEFNIEYYLIPCIQNSIKKLSLILHFSLYTGLPCLEFCYNILPSILFQSIFIFFNLSNQKFQTIHAKQLTMNSLTFKSCNL